MFGFYVPQVLRAITEAAAAPAKTHKQRKQERRMIERLRIELFGGDRARTKTQDGPEHEPVWVPTGHTRFR